MQKVIQGSTFGNDAQERVREKDRTEGKAEPYDTTAASASAPGALELGGPSVLS